MLWVNKATLSAALLFCYLCEELKCPSGTVRGIIARAGMSNSKGYLLLSHWEKIGLISRDSKGIKITSRGEGVLKSLNKLEATDGE